MTKIMCEPILRRELREQAEEMVRNLKGCHPEKGFELVVRIEVPDLRDLDDLLNLLEVPVVEGALRTLPFRFELEVIALAREDGSPPAIWMSQSTMPRLELQADELGDGGFVILDVTATDFPSKRFQLVAPLNGRGKGVSTRKLRAALGYPDDPAGQKRLHQLKLVTNMALAQGDPAGQPRAWISSKRNLYSLHLRGQGV